VPRLPEMTDAVVTPEVLRWYVENDVPQAFRGLHPKVLREAQKRAEGDWRRVVTDGDGTLVVYNHPQWQPE
jgi:hypothetical protein